MNSQKDRVGSDFPGNSDFDGIINNNSEYSQRNYQTSNQYGNNTKSYNNNNNYRDYNSNYNSSRNNNYKKQ